MTGSRRASAPLGSARSLVAAWRTNNRVTMYLVEHLPVELWNRAAARQGLTLA